MTDSSDTLDALFGGRLTFYQGRAGYRVSIDALLLAEFVTIKPSDRVVDLGSGNGVVALVLAQRHASINVTGVEIQPAMVLRGEKNAVANGLAGRVEFHQGDVRRIKSLIAPASVEAVVCNPPYRRAASGRISAQQEKRLARHEIAGQLTDFVGAASHLLRAKGRFAAIYSAQRTADLVAAMRAARLEPKRLRFVHSFADAEAGLVLAEGVKDGRSGVSVLPPLSLYRQGKEYSAEAAAIIAGTAARITSKEDSESDN